MFHTISNNSFNCIPNGDNNENDIDSNLSSYYKSSEYIEKIFKYLLSINKETEINLTNKQILELFQSKILIQKISDKNIDFGYKEKKYYIYSLPKRIQKLYYNFLYNLDNYILAYYLHRLYMKRLDEGNKLASKFYLEYFHFLVSTDDNIYSFNTNNIDSIKKKYPELKYGPKMNKITIEYIKNNYIKEVVEYEDIDEILEDYLDDIRENIQNMKLTDINTDISELDQEDIFILHQRDFIKLLDNIEKILEKNDIIIQKKSKEINKLDKFDENEIIKEFDTKNTEIQVNSSQKQTILYSIFYEFLKFIFVFILVGIFLELGVFNIIINVCKLLINKYNINIMSIIHHFPIVDV